MFKTSKRLVAMLICLAMVLSMVPAVFAADGTTTVYYYNSNNWSTVKVHYWGGVQSSWPGVNMTDLGNGYWSFEVPAGATGMLFNNGSGSQTGDLKVPTDSNNCYAGGAWVPYTGGTIEIVKATVYCDATACGWTNVNAYYWGGSDSCSWPGTAMTAVGDGVYSIELSPDTANIIFNNGSAQTDDLKFPGDGYIWNGSKFVDYATYTPVGGEVVVDTNYYLRGSMNSWGADESNKMTDNGDGTWSITMVLASGDYQYKAAWADWSNAVGDPNASNADGNAELSLSAETEVTFVLDTNAGTLTASYSVEPECEHEYTYECDVVCNKCYEITREASHSIIAVEAKAATCYENGNIAYWYCEHCGSAWTDEACTQVTNMMSVVVPMAHADAIHVEAKAATCYENGNIEYWYCEACGQAWLDEACTLNTNLKAVILPAAHEAAIHVEAKAATCYENGNIEYWYCEACGQAWLDADCTLNTNLKAVILPMAHAEATHVAAKAPTCSENGNIEYWYCADCGQAWLDADCTLNTNLKAVVLPTADHEYFYPCDAHCMNCGELTNPDASHNVIHVEAVEATCTEMGNVEYWACSDCGGCWLNEALTMQTNRYSVITYADHDYQNNICSVCGDMDVEIKYQVSDDGTAIRLIAYVDDLAKYSSVSFIIYANGNEISCDVTKGYTSIRGGDVVYTTSDLFGADGSLALLTLNGVPADAELSVDVCYNGLDGETTYAYRYITLAAE